MVPESNAPVSDVTVCATVSVLIQVTVVFGVMTNGFAPYAAAPLSIAPGSINTTTVLAPPSGDALITAASAGDADPEVGLVLSSSSPPHAATTSKHKTAKRP